jgi:branched-chain amino acid transport system ATP-binding protein
MIEQNALDALAISDRAYILVLGQNRQDGPAADLANDPEIRTIFLGG